MINFAPEAKLRSISTEKDWDVIALKQIIFVEYYDSELQRGKLKCHGLECKVINLANNRNFYF